MSLQPPVINAKRNVFSNEWITVVEKDVTFAEGNVEQYYSLDLDDYVTVYAETPDGEIALVQQFRPAVEQFTLELPAGMVDPGESPEEACVRELREETGLEVESIQLLGSYLADSGRISNQVHVYKAQTKSKPIDFECEPGMALRYVTLPELYNLIATGEFSHQLHLAAVLVAILPGLQEG